MDTDDLPLPSDADYGALLGLLLEHALRHGLSELVDGLALVEKNDCTKFLGKPKLLPLKI
jgi:hypothetical protein